MTVLNLTPQQTAELMAKWLMKAASVDSAAGWGRDAGYQEASLFGAARRHARLYEEVALLHGAIAIFAIDHVLPLPFARQVTESFGELAHTLLFPAFERHDPSFRGRWAERRTRYVSLLQGDRQAIALSIAFLQTLGVDPLRHLSNQVQCAARIAQTVADAQGVLGHVRLRRPRTALEQFEDRLRDWPALQADSARRLMRALREGRVSEASMFYDRLSVAQSREVHEVLEEMDRAGRG